MQGGDKGENLHTLLTIPPLFFYNKSILTSEKRDFRP